MSGELGEPPSTLPTVSNYRRHFNYYLSVAAFLKSKKKPSTGRNQLDRPDIKEKEEGDSKRAGWLHGTYMAELL